MKAIAIHMNGPHGDLTEIELPCLFRVSMRC